MFRKLKDAATLYKALGQWSRIRKDIDTMDIKSIFQSKTFWVNVLILVLTVADVMPVKWAMYITPIANVLLRMLTNQPVTLTGKKSTPQE